MITHERLLQAAHYDSETGVFTRKMASKFAAGTQMGSVSDKGYLVITIDGKSYKAHRLAWFYVHKAWPKRIDHENGIKTENNLKNLREATQQQNCFNRPATKGKKWKGAYWRKDAGTWFALIVVGGIRHHLGYFDSEREAAEAYLFAALNYHGEFAKAA